jgi:hypothetical protein
MLWNSLGSSICTIDMVGKVLMLVQSKSDTDEGRYKSFGSLEEGFDFVVRIFEDRLRAQFAGKENFSYELIELYEFLDSLQEIACLVRSEETNSYVSHDLNWVKGKLYSHLTQQLTQISFDS